MSKKVTELTPEEIEDAKNMYLEHYSVAEIARKYDVGRTSMSYHANKKWKAEKEMMKSELFSRFTATKKESFTRMSSASIKVVTRALQALAERSEAPTVREAKDATAILEALDKITRLDDGNPTDIIAEKPANIKDIRAKLLLDPFGDIEDVECKKIPEKTD